MELNWVFFYPDHLKPWKSSKYRKLLCWLGFLWQKYSIENNLRKVLAITCSVHSQRTRLLLMLYLCKHQKRLPLPCSDTTSGLSNHCPSHLSSPFSKQQPSPWYGAALWIKWGQRSHLAQAGVQAKSVGGNQPATCAVSIHPLCPVSGVSKHVSTTHEQSPGFPQPSYYPTRTILLKLFQKIAEDETLPNSFYEATITLDTKTRQKQ